MRTTIFFGFSKSFPVNPGPTQTGLNKNNWSTQKVRGKDNWMHCQVRWIHNKTFEEDLTVCKSCCFLAREAGQQSGRGLMTDRLVKVMIFGKQTVSPPATNNFYQILSWKRGLFLTFRMGTSNARNKNLRPLFNTNIPPISGKYGLRNHFWSLESGFLMRKREENDFFSKSAKLPILSFWILNVHIIICQFQKRSTVIHFFSLSPCSCH